MFLNGNELDHVKISRYDRRGSSSAEDALRKKPKAPRAEVTAALEVVVDRGSALRASSVGGSGLRDSVNSRPVDGVLVADPDGYDVAGVVIDLSVNQAESSRPLAWDVELDPCKSGEIAADAPLTE